MEMVAFIARPRDDVDQQEYQQTFERMLALVTEIPGFVDIRGFADADGTELALVRFMTREAIEEWREHPEHVRLGRGQGTELTRGEDPGQLTAAGRTPEAGHGQMLAAHRAITGGPVLVALLGAPRAIAHSAPASTLRSEPTRTWA